VDPNAAPKFDIPPTFAPGLSPFANDKKTAMRHKNFLLAPGRRRYIRLF
jgi:hypothetical protein